MSNIIEIATEQVTVSPGLIEVLTIGTQGPPGPLGPTGPQGPVGPRAGIEFSRAGELIVYQGTHRWYNDTGSARTIDQVRATVGEAPTGQALIADVNVNTVSIYTDQSQRPTIAPGSNTDLGGTPDFPTMQPGDWLTVDIDQVGSPIPGADLVVQITLS
jgi:hypothetical protein